MKLFKLFFLVFFSLSIPVALFAQDETEDLDLLDLDLASLLQVEVTSVSKTAERLQDVPTSLYVLTSADIEKSGATQLHEVLMLVPGYWGVQTSYSDVSFGMRYSAPDNGQIGSTLFLLDGTSMQELMGGGFSWRNFDIPLEDIDRIEVIKGSGGTIYGANSATGVVSIFTKNPDKYKGVSMKVDAASPEFISASISGGATVGDFGFGGYAKLRHFNGYGILPEFSGDNVTVPAINGGNVTIPNRFSDNYDALYSSTFGFKVDYNISEKSKLSYRNHVNLSDKISYTSVFDPNTFFQTDKLYRNQINRSRVVSNLRFDTELSENNSLFVRMSTNREDDFYNTAGGYQTSNTFLDFEAQDNIALGESNSLSIGANYRLVHFDVYNINASEQLAYTDPKSNEDLIGFFAQDKLRLLDGKLNLTLGGKFEKFTLVNDNFYFSPQAKFSFIPTEKLTFWGGYSKSFTTPGFNQTNVDLGLFRVPAYEFFFVQALPQITDLVYQQVYNTYISGGADDATASQAATDYVASPQGQNDIYTNTDATANSYAAPYSQNGASTYNVGVTNGSNTQPTSFTNYEFGIRTSFIKNVTIEANAFYTEVQDGIAPTENIILTAQKMTAIENSYADYYLYGNYTSAISKGFEAIIKAIPTKGLSIETSYTYLDTQAEYQENPDFDIATLSPDQINLTRDTPLIPSGIFRWRASYDFAGGFNIALNGLHSTIYDSQSRYVYEKQGYESIIAGLVGLPRGEVVAANDTRNIVNFKLNKSLADDKMDIYIYGNDILNKGRIENTDNLGVITLSQTKAMFGLGFQLNF